MESRTENVEPGLQSRRTPRSRPRLQGRSPAPESLVSPHQTKGFVHAGVARPGPASGEQGAVDPSDAAPPADRAVHPPFHSLGIIGLGLIGGSLALAARRAWPAIRIVGVDRGAALEAARWLVAFDALADAPAAVRGADLVVLAAPVRQNAIVLRELASVLGEDVLVTDVGSTKRAIADAAGELPPQLSFIGGHPLAGAARGGLDLARGDLFEGRRWLLTPGPAHLRHDHLARLQAFVSGLGAVPQVMTRGRARSPARVSQSPATADRHRADRHRRPRGGRPHRPRGPRPRRHDPAGLQPLGDLGRHLRHQR